LLYQKLDRFLFGEEQLNDTPALFNVGENVLDFGNLFRLVATELLEDVAVLALERWAYD
jgi:hypothetical protein